MGRINIVSGPNFSGRSVLLKTLTGYGANAPQGIYIGENPRNMLTALNRTVMEELRFHDRAQLLDSPLVQTYISSIGYQALFERNPFELSGGEQAVLALLCGLFLAPSNLAIDTLTEQLSGSWRQETFRLLENLPGMKVFLSDNRFVEYRDNGKWSQMQPSALQNLPNHIPGLPKSLNGSVEFPASVVFPKSVSIKDLSFAYGKANIFESVSLELEPGNVYQLSGGNGSGKSTFSKLLSGILRPFKGHFEVDGVITNFFKAPGKFVGYAFQNPDDQLFANSVRQEIFHNTPPEVVGFVTDAFGLAPLMDLHPFDLPYVIRKRIALAATLANPRSWYILDEPTLGMDASSVEHLSVLIQKMARQGIGFLLTSHSSQFLERFKSSRKLTINNHKIKVGQL